MRIADLVAQAPQRGIVALGVTDHLQTFVNLPDLAASRQEYLAANPPPGMHFGVEVSAVSQWELDRMAEDPSLRSPWGIREGGPAGGALAIGLTAEDIARLEIEYVVGGAHWPLYVPIEPEAVIRDYHRQNMFLATHPLVDIVAHPWWWMGHWRDEDGRYTTHPWLGDFGVIPQSMHDEFAAAAREHGTVVEANLVAIILNRHYPEQFRRQYLEYLAGLKARGVTLSIGSDCHSANYDTDFDRAAALLESVGLTDADFWRLPVR